jgi:hypothetical protein
MVPNSHLHQAVAQLIGGAFAGGAAAITVTELVQPLRRRGSRVDHATASTRLEARELGNGRQRVRRAAEAVVTAIYAAIPQFLGSARGRDRGTAPLASRPPSAV